MVIESKIGVSFVEVAATFQHKIFQMAERFRDATLGYVDAYCIPLAASYAPSAASSSREN